VCPAALVAQPLRMAETDKSKMTPFQLKVALQKTSIYLGSDSVDYSTEARDREQQIVGKYVKEDTLDLQAELQGSHLQLAHSEEPNDYVTTNTLLDPTGDMDKYRGKLNTHAMKMLRTSSLHFGNDSTNYESVAKSANNLDFSGGKQGLSKAQLAAQKQQLSRTNYVLGDERLNYKTCLDDDFPWYKGARPADLDAEAKKDLRASHFDTGTAGQGGDYSTSNAMADATGRIHEYTAVLNDKAKAMLLRSSLCFGAEKVDYQSTAERQQLQNPASAVVEPYDRNDKVQY